MGGRCPAGSIGRIDAVPSTSMRQYSHVPPPDRCASSFCRTGRGRTCISSPPASMRPAGVDPEGNNPPGRNPCRTTAPSPEFRSWVDGPHRGCANVVDRVLLGRRDGCRPHGVAIPFPERDPLPETERAALFRSRGFPSRSGSRCGGQGSCSRGDGHRPGRGRCQVSAHWRNRL